MHIRPLLLPGLAIVVLACSDRQEPPVELQRVERTGFALDLPAWPVGHDEDARMVGRYQVQQGRRLVEASWSASVASSVDELGQIGSSIQQGLGVTLHDRQDETLPDQVRLHLTFNVQDNSWAAMSIVQCVTAGVLVTLSVSDERRERAVAMRDRVLSTLACPEDASKFAGVWPTTDLPRDFGALVDEAVILGHRDGRWLMVAAMAASTVQKMVDSHLTATQTLATFGSLFGSAFKPIATASSGRTYSGPASVWRIEPDTMGELVVAAFVCPEARIGYVVIAGDDGQATGHAELEALSLRFACPGATARSSFRGELTPLLERPGVCEVGAEALCERSADEG